MPKLVDFPDVNDASVGKYFEMQVEFPDETTYRFQMEKDGHHYRLTQWYGRNGKKWGIEGGKKC